MALVASEFGFLGGSIGVATAERITRAVERATAERLPLVALPVSGGTRMQEGSAAFLCMLRITAAVQAHRAAGLPYLSYLRNPTMGGVFASWGTLGQLVFAEPRARLGFLGPRVYQELRGVELPADVQLAETLAGRGLVDAVVAPEDLREVLRRSLAVLAPAASVPDSVTAPEAVPAPDTVTVPDTAPAPDTATAREPDAWDSVRRTRRPDRPGARELLRRTADELVLLDAPGGRGGALVRALAVLHGRPALIVGQQRQGPDHERPFTAADLRAVRRSARLAEQLGLPLVTVVDTAGAELSAAAELDGIAVEIAHCLTTLLALRTPVLAVLLGQGSGGGALALLPADRVLAALPRVARAAAARGRLRDRPPGRRARRRPRPLAGHRRSRPGGGRPGRRRGARTAGRRRRSRPRSATGSAGRSARRSPHSPGYRRPSGSPPAPGATMRLGDLLVDTARGGSA